MVAAPKADVHSQQRFHYMGHKGKYNSLGSDSAIVLGLFPPCLHAGELVVDQAHRGYTACTDAGGYASINPLYMAYLPGTDGNFNGHHGYGYKSIEAFVQAAQDINAGVRGWIMMMGCCHDMILMSCVLDVGNSLVYVTCLLCGVACIST